MVFTCSSTTRESVVDDVMVIGSEGSGTDLVTSRVEKPKSVIHVGKSARETGSGEKLWGSPQPGEGTLVLKPPLHQVRWNCQPNQERIPHSPGGSRDCVV